MNLPDPKIWGVNGSCQSADTFAAFARVHADGKIGLIRIMQSYSTLTLPKFCMMPTQAVADTTTTTTKPRKTLRNVDTIKYSV